MTNYDDTSCPRLIGKDELLERVPYSPQHLLRLENQGRFPKRIHLGPNRVAWVESEIAEWIRSRMRARAGPDTGQEVERNEQPAFNSTP